jgi:hypothetical protein
MFSVNRRNGYDTEDGIQYYYISNKDCVYCDDDGNTYKFDTYEEAQEKCNELNEED